MQTHAGARAPSGPEAEYFAHLDQGRFLIQRCGGCRAHVFFPRAVCPHCGATRLDWVAPSGRGTVYSFSVIAGRPGVSSDYNVALVDLEEGVRLMSRVEGVPPALVRIGMPVQAQVRVTDGKGMVVFLAGGEA
ncbi:Zn-ribbon domain-containing OB-fold protein [Cupriavidus respiraculi]|uniref:DNA-binding protein n=1 Tax=Cupriavidus respiraculi TaxID=195930 RepID=A0ABM8WI88_9BURK|nr:Zn-ribbon domain-containing OB-fold protein [Cupriavidus respiraculi]MBY4948084.1 Zn-ribbon domain-containing OB-fold protein [Cupriavidus respiraculi]CAG9167101.1 hypothetical protein LMG21510_00652 [Cupriavidus respiraculi]